MLALRVEKGRVHDVLRRLLVEGLVNRNLRTSSSGEFVFIPLSSRPDMSVEDTLLVDYDRFVPRKSSKPIERIKESLDIPQELKGLIPYKWERIGNILIFKLHPSLNDWRTDIAKAYSSVLKTKTVFEDIGGVRDEFRIPVLEKILGEETETIHRENGILYKLDVSKLMFSSGNKHERMRMTGFDINRETVLDMFAGIGYFSLPIAKYCSPKRVIACEKNPSAFHYLLENIRLNRLDNIRPILKDCRDLELDEKVDRIVMGYVKETHTYLGKAFELIENGGTIHYHDAYPVELLPDGPVAKITAEASIHNRRIAVKNLRRVKSYAPKVAHIVLDIVVY